jgi:hypothetical protein
MYMLQQTAPSASPFWLEITKTITGPLMAAVFVVVGIWLKEVYERKKAAQAWFEQYYITEGLDQFIAHLYALSVATINIVHPALQAEAVNQLPFTINSRMLTLVGDRKFVRAPFHFRAFHHNLKTMEEAPAGEKLKGVIGEAAGAIEGAAKALEQLRKELLVVSVTTKSDIYGIHDKPTITKLITEIDEEYGGWFSKNRDIITGKKNK